MIPKGHIPVESLPDHLRFFYGDYACAISNLTLRENRKLQYMLNTLKEKEKNENQNTLLEQENNKNNGKRKTFFLTEVDGKAYQLMIDIR